MKETTIERRLSITFDELCETLKSDPICFIETQSRDYGTLVGVKWYNSRAKQFGFVYHISKDTPRKDITRHKILLLERMLKFGWLLYIRPRRVGQWLAFKLIF